MAVTFFLAVIAAATGYIWAGAGLCAVALLIRYYIKSKFISKRWYLLILFYVISYLFAVDNMSQSDLKSHIYKDYEKIEVNATVKGTIKSVSEKSYGYFVLVSNCEIELTGEDTGKDAKAGMAVYIYENSDECMADNIAPGQKVSFYGSISSFGENMNEGGFNSEAYYKSIGVDYKLIASRIRIISEAGEIDKFIYAVRKRAEKVYDSVADESDRGVLKAIVLGNKDELDEELYNKYQKNGISHILAISGVKTLKLDIPLVPETRINWTFVPLHIAIIYILKLCLDEEIIPRCRFPCSRGYLTKYIN